MTLDESTLTQTSSIANNSIGLGGRPKGSSIAEIKSKKERKKKCLNSISIAFMEKKKEMKKESKNVPSGFLEELIQKKKKNLRLKMTLKCRLFILVLAVTIQYVIIQDLSHQCMM